MKLKHFSLLFSITGIALLYFMSLLVQPAIIEIQEIPNHEGRQITTQGIVTYQRFSSFGNQMITIEDNNASAIVFVEGETDVEYGDILEVTGEVQKYNNEWEIIVNNIRYVVILQKWNNISIPLWQIAGNPMRYIGLNVNITGFIDMVYDSFFNLVDLDDKFTLKVFYTSSNNISLYHGMNVSVSGVFSYDEKNFEYYLKQYGGEHRIFPMVAE